NLNKNNEPNFNNFPVPPLPDKENLLQAHCVKNDNHSDLRKENHELRQQLAEVKKQLAEVLEELRKLKNNSSGSDSEKLEQQIIHNEKLIKNSEAVSVNEIKDQINKSQALMNKVSATGVPNKDDK
ncbi:28934_t:CDS:2, partial [Racocetra persica]